MLSFLSIAIKIPQKGAKTLLPTMTRPLRFEYPGAFYHVLNRGANRAEIFPNPAGDRTLFIDTLADVVRLWKIRVHAYTLMNNHYHRLIETPLGNLSRGLRHLDGVYTQRFNRVHHRDGPVFRGRFKSILVQKDNYFLELIRYIHLNSVRAGLYSAAQEDPFSSHQAYLDPTRRPWWLTTESALSFFSVGGATPHMSFDNFVSQGVPSNVMDIMHRKKWPAVLGSDDFIRGIRDQFIRTDKPHEDVPQEKQLLRSRLPSVGHVLEGVAQRHRMSKKGLCDRKGDMENTREARKEAIYLLRHMCLLSLREIGRELGGISYGAVSKTLRTLNSQKLFSYGHPYPKLEEKWFKVQT
jgi:putative transposase